MEYSGGGWLIKGTIVDGNGVALLQNGLIP
jgi:hypothetical protein